MNISSKEIGYRRLVDIAQAAALDQRQWDWFLKALCEISGIPGAHLFVHDYRSNIALGYKEHGYAPEFMDSFDSHYSALNAWAPAYFSATVGDVVTSRSAISDAEMEKTEIYNDWIRPQEDIIGGAFSVLARDRTHVTLIGGNIRRKDRDALEGRFQNLLQRLTPTLRHSVQVCQMLGRFAVENAVLREGMEPEDTAIFALNRSGQVQFTNRFGEKLLDDGDVVQQDPRARLRFVEPAPRAAFGRMLQDLFGADNGIGLPFFAKIQCRTPYLCRTVPIHASHIPWLTTGGADISGYVLLLMRRVVPPITGQHRP
ncbi:hypothetical protein [Aliiruegeria sabulilitoris]|uniref:hypothetical protein n=1 Tax=Aliiruegeria sabulilitoris TaxID=1510458 RepID=UPI0008314569|nr:hypothetical protein [Aliiruegeria sabulilitoris]NDR58190.1 hypothetical protein [Pseudoruegeria sp. M32A2M]